MLRHSPRARCPYSPRATGIRRTTARSRPRAASGRRIASPRPAAPNSRAVSPCRRTTVVISKAATPEADSYSGFGGTDLAARLRAGRATRLFIGGLATDYCVLNTVKDALAAGFEVLLLADAIRAVDVNAGDGARAQGEMQRLGARSIRYEDLAP